MAMERCGRIWAGFPLGRPARRFKRVPGRNDMLERVRKALRRPSSGNPSVRDLQTQFPKLEGVVTPIPPEQLVATFEAEFAKVSGSPHRASTVAELEGILRAILQEAQATSAVLTRNPLLSQLGLQARLHAWGKSAVFWPSRPAGAVETSEEMAYRNQCFSAGVGISGVDFVLAETGSLVLSSPTEGSQLASLSPPVHVALYRREQVLAILDEVLERHSLSGNPDARGVGRSTVFITGPSRTADIEQILIRGVHGPKNVHAVLVEESCLADPGTSKA